MNIGNAIKEIRKKAGMTQGTLSEATGISQTSLSKIEASGTVPSEKNLKKIAEVLGVPPSLIYILGMEETDVPEHKLESYKILFPALTKLALQMVE